jgi:hypothetical protein
MGQHYGKVLGALLSSCPKFIEPDRWQEAIHDSKRFLEAWEVQAHALGWSSRELFGLHPIPRDPGPKYSRLSRYDETGLIWVLRGRPVVALTENAAAIENPTGTVTIYRKYHKPAFGPVGDSLDDLR